MNVNTMGQDDERPAAAEHVLNTHGPDGDDPWRWVRADGSDSVDGNCFLDLGQPGVADYVVAPVRSIVTNYAVDIISGEVTTIQLNLPALPVELGREKVKHELGVQPLMPTEERVALVTGGSSGIGRGIARKLAEDGLDVVIADVRREPRRGETYHSDAEQPTSEVIRTETDSQSVFVRTDVSDESAVRHAIEESVDRFGRLDVLVNNAGIHTPGTTESLSAEEWATVIDVNLTGCFLMSKHARPHVVDAPAGRIVNISSINATFGGAGPAYAASKAGVLNLTRDLAVELAEDEVTVNAVLPGVIKTPLQDLADEETRKREQERTLLPRIGEPADVAAAVSFFVSPDASWITGEHLVVDGGYVAGYT